MSWIQTYSGRRFFPLSPRVEDVALEDIAHALALKTRFGGHGLRFYSVAEHCVRVSRILEPPLALWGLMHDAAEAYLADVPRPVKQAWPMFCQLEDHLLEVVAQRFGLAWPVLEAVWQADDILLATEARDLMQPAPEPWGLAATALEERIEPVEWQAAETLFLARYRELAAMHP